MRSLFCKSPAGNDFAELAPTSKSVQSMGSCRVNHGRGKYPSTVSTKGDIASSRMRWRSFDISTSVRNAVAAEHVWPVVTSVKVV